jgi:hypothetical protein
MSYKACLTVFHHLESETTKSTWNLVLDLLPPAFTRCRELSLLSLGHSCRSCWNEGTSGPALVLTVLPSFLSPRKMVVGGCVLITVL